MFKSLTAEERAEPLLEFLVAKKLDYGRRIRIALGLAVVGIGLQVIFLSVWPGLPLLLVAVLLCWVIGFDSRADYRSYHGGSDWRTVPYEKLVEITEMVRRTEKWDRSAIDITSGAGAALFVVVCGAVFGVGLVMLALGAGAEIVWVDGGLLIAFQWLNGMRRIDKRPDLQLRVAHLVGAVEAAGILAEEDIVVQAQLLLRGREGRELPFDAKVVVGFEDAPDHFLGVQCQVVINRVQGRAYPYCYTVLVGREGHGLLDFADRVHWPSGCVEEAQNKNGVDVVVVRQATTSKSGYHTKVPKSARILGSAVRAARSYLGASTSVA